MNHQDRQSRYTGQVFRAIESYQAFISQKETLLIGDFNSNKFWDSPSFQYNHSDLVAKLAEQQIISIYHHFYQEAQGEESGNTFYLYRHQSKGYHLDYCFMPETWAGRVKNVTLGPYETWCQFSDHTPLFVELN